MRKRALFTLLAAGTLVVGGFTTATGAAADEPGLCTIGPGVTQTETTVTGSGGDDTIDCTNASPGKMINGGAGNDTLTGTAFEDVINGGEGDDTMTGGAGNDALNGGNGEDTLTGSAGDDQLVGPSNDGAQDTLNGGDGTDSCGQAPEGTEDIVNGCES